MRALRDKRGVPVTTRLTYNRRGLTVTVEGTVLGPYRPDKKRPREVVVVQTALGHVEVAVDLIIEQEEVAA